MKEKTPQQMADYIAGYARGRYAGPYKFTVIVEHADGVGKCVISDHIETGMSTPPSHPHWLHDLQGSCECEACKP